MPSRTRRPRLLALVVVMVLASGCGSPSPSSTAAIPPSPASTAGPTIAATPVAPTPTPGPTSLTWRKGGVADLAETAALAVPLDYGNPSAGTITLIIARRRAADPSHRLGVLFVNPGGPGGPAVDLAGSSGLSTLIPQAVLDRFDVISWDPRGIGLSHGLTCPDAATLDQIESLDPDPRTPSTIGAYRTAFDAVASQCQAIARDVLPYLSEANSARDIDTIRAALGERTISYLGWSYGTYLGYLYATLFPTHLRAAVLDGAVDPTIDLVQRDVDQARGFERAFDHFLATCAAATACPFHGGGDPAAAYDALITTLERSPQGQVLDAGQAVTGTLAFLYGRDYPGLATALAEAEQGDGVRLRQVADDFFGSVSLGAYEATLCLDVPHATTTDAIAAALEQARKVAPRFGPLVLLSDQYGCLDWPASAGPAPVAGPPATLPPILIIASRWDPATPPWWADALAKALGSGIVVTRDGVGHTSSDVTVSSDCLRTAVVSYFEALRRPAAGTVCSGGAPAPWQ
ncbi:MAG TPA: alpha/beta hydrolase [Candidatus Limnocylindrales bacterium]|nr:alpha/beta hydrolase [Candidatus Limnocylindrales bacterium]